MTGWRCWRRRFRAPFNLERKMAKKICASCGREFTPRPQVRNQTFCSAPECQRERHRQWQKRKRQLDAKYRKVDAEYSSAWAVANAGYWERYRESHPDYADRNRLLQKQRNAKSRKLKAATQNPAEPGITFPTGRYQLIRIDSEGVANGNVWIVEITAIASAAG